ncbi:bifunctional DnaQ family exonuclease/ATP-dependent helicase [Streptococcus sp. LQJ-218]|uniref:bifunctional DnaQ family exonuclease/ATP-dependent helicase n=1 Tax=Streptococcus sp. LQJ-218 TaxID=2283190 RepID=UPI000E3CDDF6|nr:bifunctional DnaQ family exonuclease/ATP-dependent helicase [Streptococcus sp. LQJ-218]TAA67566.1 bifunctional DnaQ family exonuclease/ATP-dependent helicase [Streptococcus sp. LQJ-218]
MKTIGNRYVVVDLEATSTGSKAKIIQVGIVVIEDGKIVDHYTTDVNPHEPLDAHIKELTGITDQRLAQAPDFSQVARKIFDLLEDGIFVAHNVQFDANLLAENLFFEGYELRNPRVDTVELAQVFFPELEKYSLPILCRELGISLKHAHTALSDAQATAELLLFLREKMTQLPKGLLERLLEMADALLYESYLVIEEIYSSQSILSAPNLVEVQGLYFKKTVAPLEPRKLSQDFSKNISLLNLEARERQESFAKEVGLLLKDEPVSLIQAPTGIGKTYGYLLPALSQAKERQIVLSVPTKILQNQIMEEEGKRLKEVFHTDIHSLKGPQNYLKLDSFYRSLQENDENRLFRRFKMQLLVWLTETETGDLDEIGQLYRYQHFLKDLRHDGNLSSESLFVTEDFWKRSQERAQTCKLLVTNHAYLVTRLEDNPEFVSDRLLIIDEVQKILLALENLLQETHDIQSIIDLLDKALLEEQNMVQQRILESIRFECLYLIEQFQSGKSRKTILDSLANLHQYFSELEVGGFEKLVRYFTAERDYWLEATETSQKKIQISSTKSGRILLSSLIPNSCQVLGVSATLEISQKVSLADLLGYPEAKFVKIEARGKQEQEVILVEDFPLVTETSLEVYAKEVANLLMDVQAFQQPILVLFTAKDMLLAVSDMLPVSHLAQYKNGDVYQLKKRFEKGEQQILLGAGSFWEGVDFSSHPFVIQVIPRLPFQNPQEPLTKKINQELNQEGKNAFYDYQLPMAIIRLKQALGRSMRREHQRTLTLILDRRIVGKRYGKQIVTSLAKEATVKTVSQSEVDEAIDTFLNEV